MGENIWKNASGYYDPTAGEAISKMGGNKMQPTESGDIWEVIAKNGSVFQMLILKQHDGYAVGLRLFPEETASNCVEVPSMTTMYADCGRPIYTFNSSLTRLVKCLKNDIYDEIKGKVAEALDLETGGYTQSDIKKAVEKAKTEWEQEQTEIQPVNTDTKLEIERYKTAAMLYEKMYKELLAKVMQRS